MAHAPRLIRHCILVALCAALGACRSSGTGLRVTLQGEALSPDLVKLILSRADATNAISNLADVPGLPFSFVVALEDKRTTVDFEVVGYDSDAEIGRVKATRIGILPGIVRDLTMDLKTGAVVVTEDLPLPIDEDMAQAAPPDADLAPILDMAELYVPVAITASLPFSLWGTGGDVYVAAHSGLYLSRNSGAFTQVYNPSPYIAYYSIYAADTSNVFAVGEASGSNTVTRGHDTTWTKDPIANTTSPKAVFGLANNNVWAGGGDDGLASVIWHYNGTSWMKETLVGSGTIYAMHGVPGMIVAATTQDSYFSTGDGTWSDFSGPGVTSGSASPHTIFVATTMDIWMIDGTLHQTTNGGTTWKTDPFFSNARAIHGNGPNDVYVATTNKIYHSTDKGINWTLEWSAAANQNIYGLWSSGPGNLWVLGRIGQSAFVVKKGN